MYYHDLTDNNTVVLLSNRRSLDLDEFWEKLSELIETHAKE